MTESKKESSFTKTSEDKEVPKSNLVPAKFKELVGSIEKLSVIELSELVKVLEDKFGVSASTPMMMAAAPAPGEKGDEESEEKTSFTVELKSTGDQKINVIRAIREITELTLKDAKDMTDNTPKVIKEGVGKEEAEEIKKKLEGAGATIELK